MPKDIFIGIDGGATHCRAIVQDCHGHTLGEGQGGPANISISVEQSWKSIYDAIGHALNQSNLALENSKYQFHVGMGLAGCEWPNQYQAFIRQPHPFATLVVKQDSYTACLGAHAGNDGAIIIIGTGSVGLALDHGKIVQVGGWGFPQDDLGSGAWIGLRAISLTLQWLDGRWDGPQAFFFEKIFKQFGEDLTALLTWIHQATSTRFAEMAVWVIRGLEEEDSVSLSIIREAASHIDRIGEALIKKTIDQPLLPFALIGGIVPFIQPYLSSHMKSRLISPQFSPEVGAILVVKKELK